MAEALQVAIHVIWKAETSVSVQERAMGRIFSQDPFMFAEQSLEMSCR